jgi:hypothetical protein
MEGAPAQNYGMSSSIHKSSTWAADDLVESMRLHGIKQDQNDGVNSETR